jgi:hypothetical protein
MRKPYFKKSHQAWYFNHNGKPVRLGQTEQEAMVAWAAKYKETDFILPQSNLEFSGAGLYSTTAISLRTLRRPSLCSPITHTCKLPGFLSRLPGTVREPWCRWSTEMNSGWRP